MRQPAPETATRKRFFSFVEKNEACWIWKGSVHKREGYGSFYPRQFGTTLAHRISYIWSKGAIPAGYQVDHLCRVRACVNPDHLEAVTPRENTLRGMGLQAQNARKTHCPEGHELAGANLDAYQLTRGRRQCKTCKHAKINALKRARKAVAA